MGVRRARARREESFMAMEVRAVEVRVAVRPVHRVRGTAPESDPDILLRISDPSYLYIHPLPPSDASLPASGPLAASSRLNGRPPSQGPGPLPPHPSPCAQSSPTSETFSGPTLTSIQQPSNQSSSCGGARGGAGVGGTLGKERCSRIRTIAPAAVIAAIQRRREPHLGQVNTSWPNTRFISSAHE